MADRRERRKHPRARVRIPVKFRMLQSGPPKVLQTQSLDYSRGGMSFRCPEFIPHRSSVHVEFSPPDRTFPVRIVSEVVGTRKHPGGDHYIVGIKFQERPSL